MAEKIVLEIARYAPERDEKPSFQSFEVPFRKEWVVLDALNHIKDKMDGSLTYRWSCRMGVCGSCGMMVNGEPKLTCATFLSSYANGAKVRVEPLRYFPVIRDLVTALSDFMVKLQSVKPWLIRKDEPPLSAGEFLQTPEQLDLYKQFSMCINCTLCYAACPVVGLEPTFVGQRRWRSRNATTWTTAIRGRRSDWVCWRIRRGFGGVRLLGNARGFVRSMLTRRGRSSSTSLRLRWSG